MDGKRWTTIQIDKPDINIAITESSFDHGIERHEFGIKHRAIKGFKLIDS
jgi:hypothetical protein